MLQLRKDLSAQGMLKNARAFFDNDVTDKRVLKKNSISLTDALMSGVALFQFKFPSLLQFDIDCRYDAVVKENLKALFQVERAPSDTQLREILDRIDPNELRGVFKSIFALVQRGKLLEEFVYLHGSYLLALDGTGVFSSKSVHCPNCCEKHHKDGSISYYHQLVAGVLLHPEKKAVLPLAPESIVQQDGSNKNDCERNAVARFLEDFRKEHPYLPVIVTEDGLSSNGPHIEDLRKFKMRFILGCKPGDHKSLFEAIEEFDNLGAVTHFTITDDLGVEHRFRYMNGVSLNDSNLDCKINFLEYWETINGETKHWSWVTDLEIDKKTLMKLMRAGRARWSIENETFNTLKNQGYNLERNFGHGYEQLTTILTLLMFLAFTIDQVQQIACRFFQVARERLRTKRELWAAMRSFIQQFLFKGWEDFMKAMAYGIAPPLSFEFNTS
jgi:hypothetical protein